MKLSEAIYERIKELAEKNRLTLYKLSIKCGIPKSTISSFKKCKSIGTYNIYCICEGLDISIKDFFNSPLFNRENVID